MFYNATKVRGMSKQCVLSLGGKRVCVVFRLFPSQSESGPSLGGVADLIVISWSGLKDPAKL